MLWLPTLKAELVKVAMPPKRMPVPTGLPPSRKVTAPVGVPLPGALAETVAVRVTDCPKTDVLADETSAVLLAALFTV